MASHEVRKRDGRLWIMESGRPVYTPPDFVRVRMTSREPLVAMAAELDDGRIREIDAIMRFEERFSEGAKS